MLKVPANALEAKGSHCALDLAVRRKACFDQVYVARLISIVGVDGHGRTTRQDNFNAGYVQLTHDVCRELGLGHLSDRFQSGLLLRLGRLRFMRSGTVNSSG